MLPIFEGVGYHFGAMNQIEYSRTHPFMASVAERYPLTKSGSSKSTYHMVLDLRGSGMHYKVGDSIAVYPLNDLAIINKILNRLGCSGDEPVITKKVRRLPLANSFHHEQISIAAARNC